MTAIHLLLLSPLPDVQLPALQCLAFLVFGNPTVASVVAASALEDGHSLVDAVVTFMDRHHKVEMQLAAARVVSYLNRQVFEMVQGQIFHLLSPRNRGNRLKNYISIA